ncbi:MAG: DUF1549 domain-containing protein [Planctomycetaceae bacterium]|nr:DUF1549 domain-containing protein [Planctomycetaceae bacterium]
MLRRWFVCSFGSMVLVLALCVPSNLLSQDDSNSASDASDVASISYAKQIRPVLQAKCFGCHQPSHAGGGLDLTQHEHFLTPADSGQPSIVPGAPDKSPLVAVVTTANGPPAMPPSGDPLTIAEQELLRTWIAQGASNDWVSPYVVPTATEPPVYARIPSLTALDASPAGSWLAVSGTHEVFLFDTQTKKVRHRLIGMSPRIESARFSPDGGKLAVAGGRPAEFGELQVWDCQSGELIWSRTVTADVVRGVQWSPDGTKISIGCNDKSVRAFDAQSAKQVLFQNVSDDWVHDTVFSVDGTHLISVGRDRTCKLTEVATERFVDNITSITPGVLKGGITALARHPNRDEILIGGADGIPKVYRIHRLTTRVIGDDANLIRRFPPVVGGIQAVAISPQGNRLAVGSSHEGRGEVQIYGYEFDTALPPELAPLLVKVVGTRSPEEDKAIEDYVTRDIKHLAKVPVESGVFSIVFDRNNEHLWCGTATGTLKQIQISTGEVVWQGSPISLAEAQAVADLGEPKWRLPETKAVEGPVHDAREKTAPQIQALKVFPPSVTLTSNTSYVQFVVMGQIADGSWVDVTQQAEFSGARISVDASGLGQVMPGEFVGLSDNSTDDEGQRDSLIIRCLDHQLEIPLQVTTAEPEIQFVRDIQPMLTRLGCNAGSCHGAADGKNGFKLSLRGYDRVFDIRSLTDELWMRRVNVANPDQSLVLQKATGAVPHQGGRLIEADSKAYWMLHQWIANGAVLESQPVRTTRIELEPNLPVLQAAGDTQQMRVVAFLSDGSQRDVSRDAFVEIADLEIGQVSGSGRVTAVRRGETPVMARYDGCYVATTLTVMGDRTGFVWTDPPQFNAVDGFVSEKWKRMKIQPAPLCSDHEFIRRVCLDLTGLPPTPQQVEAFVADNRSTTEKRNELVDRLLADPAYVDYWTNKWADLLQVNSKFLGTEGARGFHAWIREQIAANLPYDQFVRKILTATGSNRENPPAAYFKILREPELMMENTTHLFLATRFNCNKCHDHPFERWTQDQYYQIAAYFAQTGLSEDPASAGQRIGGSAVEGAQPLYEMVADKTDGEIMHGRTRSVTPPKFPYELRSAGSVPNDDRPSSNESNSETPVPSRREQLADWVVSPANPYFASTYVNRVWGYLLGRGLIEPLDDVRASNPPSNPELLAFLEKSFVDSGFDTRQLMALICKSRTYQLSVEANDFNRDDTVNYSKAKAKRLPAEVLFDAMHASVGAKLNIPGVPEGTRAAQLADVATAVPSGFLATLGRPVRESACECERSDELQLGAILAMVNGPDVARLVSDPQNKITQLASDPTLDDLQLVNAVYMQVLNRPATTEEVQGILGHKEEILKAHRDLQQAMSERAAWWTEERQRKEAERVAAINKAQTELAEYIAQHDPGLADREQQHAARINTLKEQRNAYQANEATELARWRHQQLTAKLWHVPVPIHWSQSNESQLAVQPDRSIRATLGTGVVETTLQYETNLPSITGVRLEVLADPELPGGGPGLAPNGNLVVSEWVIEVAPTDQPDQWQNVAVVESLADFHQVNYSPDKMFNGAINDGDGWALHPDTKKTHWVVCRFAEPVQFPNGVRWRMRLVQHFSDAQHALGRFRISFTTNTAGLDLGLAEPLLAELATIRAENAESLLAITPPTVLAAFRAGDQHRRALEQQLAEASKPLEILPGIVERRAALQFAERPVADDRVLTQLQADLQRSQTQVDQLRLTLAQDLTWALINSPAFMFNH